MCVEMAFELYQRPVSETKAKQIPKEAGALGNMLVFMIACVCVCVCVCDHTHHSTVHSHTHIHIVIYTHLSTC